MERSRRKSEKFSKLFSSAKKGETLLDNSFEGTPPKAVTSRVTRRRKPAEGQTATTKTPRDPNDERDDNERFLRALPPHTAIYGRQLILPDIP